MKHNWIWRGKKEGYICADCGATMPNKDDVTSEVANGACKGAEGVINTEQAALLADHEARLKALEAATPAEVAPV